MSGRIVIEGTHDVLISDCRRVVVRDSVDVVVIGNCIDALSNNLVDAKRVTGNRFDVNYAAEPGAPDR